MIVLMIDSTATVFSGDIKYRLCRFFVVGMMVSRDVYTIVKPCCVDAKYYEDGRARTLFSVSLSCPKKKFSSHSRCALIFLAWQVSFVFFFIFVFE